MNPQFTIIVPVRNGEAHFRQCVQSVLAQTRSDWELLVLDNDSQDDNVAWLHTLNDARIHIFPSLRPLSIEENWARAVEVPKTEFLTLLSHDDLLDPAYLQVMHDLIVREPNATLYQAQFRLIDAQGDVLRAATSQPARETASEFLSARLQRRRESFGTGYMMRSRDYERVGGIPPFAGLIFADDALWLRLMRGGFKATDARETFGYRVHSSSASVQATWHVHLRAMEAYLEELQDAARSDGGLAAVLQRDGPAYFLWHCHYLYVLALTEASINNRRIARETVRELNRVLSLIAPGWTLATQRPREVRVREAVNRSPLLRRLYNRARQLRCAAS